MTDVEGPIISISKDVLSFSGERAPKTKILVPSKRVDSSILDLSISDMTELKENGDVENIKIIAKISALMTHYHTLLKINRWELSLNLRQALDRPKERLLPKGF